MGKEQPKTTLTYDELLTLECSLISSIYDLDNRINELKDGSLTDDSKVKLLKELQKHRDDYNELFEKIQNSTARSYPKEASIDVYSK